jgi:hypothetical protein
MPDKPTPPQLPYDQLRTRVGEDPHARQALDALHATLKDPQAERSNVERHVGLLRKIPTIAALIENWYDSPATQSWLKTLSDLGF